MSGRRRAVTGTQWSWYLVLGIGLVVVWNLPEMVRQVFPELVVVSKEPWQMTLADLTWQRVLANALTKPGFRFIGMGFVFAGWFGARLAALWWRELQPPSQWRFLSPRFRSMDIRSSAEWVIDSRWGQVPSGTWRGSPLAEYARWAGESR